VLIVQTSLLRAYWLLELFNFSSIYKKAEENALIQLGNVRKKKFSRYTKITIASYCFAIIIQIICVLISFDELLGNCASISPTNTYVSINSSYVLLLLVAIICIAFIFTIKKVQDAFNILNEFVGLIIMCIALSLTVFFGQIASNLINFLTMLLYFSLAYTWPVFLSFKFENRPIPNEVLLENALENPIYLTAFIEYCIKEFSTEQPLFYGDIIKFKKKFNILSTSEEKKTIN